MGLDEGKTPDPEECGVIHGVLALLGVVAAGFSGVFFRDVYIHRKSLDSQANFKLNIVIGFVTDFFDTLGIGNFAPTTALFKIFRQVKDRLLPGTLNVSHTIPVVLEAFLFLTVIEVDIVTLLTMILAAVFGAVIGAGYVVKLPERRVQFAMGIALTITGCFMILGQFGLIENLGTGEAIGLRGLKLAIGISVNFVLGALMTIGVGLYAPCMALVYMLGLSPVVAFPIMMGSCAFLMPPASVKFIRAGAYDRKAALGITIGGVFGVLIAVFLVKSLPLAILTWMVIGVIFVTSFALIRGGIQRS